MKKNEKGKLMKSIVFGPFKKSFFMDIKRGSRDALVEATVNLKLPNNVGIRGMNNEPFKVKGIGPLEDGDIVIVDLYVRIENPKKKNRKVKKEFRRVTLSD